MDDRRPVAPPPRPRPAPPEPEPEPDRGGLAEGPFRRLSTLLRGRIRHGEVGLIALAGVVGAATGLIVAGVGKASWTLQSMLFGLSPTERLSGSLALHKPLAILAPAGGGLVLALLGLALARLAPRSRQPVDPIEANALHGGRIPARDGVEVVAQNIVSNGSGASVGLEAGYTQAGATAAAFIGSRLGLRRSDLRLLVGCGAAAAISAAFSAPLTGAFYAFELVIGTYSLAGFLPVVVAALASDGVVSALNGPPIALLVGEVAPIGAGFYPLSLLLGVAAGLVAIGIMRSVSAVERMMFPVPAFFRPAVGGLVVGLLAMTTTRAVLGAGHGALHLVLDLDMSLKALAVLLLAKATASAVSVGAGFRGGLFFASLLLGAVLGRVGGAVAAALGAPPEVLDAGLWATTGMAAFGAAIVGAPLAMTFMVIETTGAFAPALAVLPAVAAAALTVRRLFGFSFATWRFHLRGEAIRSAHDIGWVRDLTVGRLMRHDPRTAPLTMPLATFRATFPLGSITRVVMLDGNGHYAGIVLVSEAHGTVDAEAGLAPLLHYPDVVLNELMDAKAAMALFDRSGAEALAVVAPATGFVTGLLTESHLLRRYGEELERRRQDETGLNG